jgi:glycosyltransferase involved in cell wall biosynthesis
MRLLFVSTIMPYPPIYGSAIRTWSLLRALASEGVETTFLTFTSDSEPAVDLQPLHELCRSVKLVYLAPKSLSSSADYAGRAMALASRHPYATVRYRSREMYQLLEEQLSTTAFDAVFADEIFALVNMPPIVLPLIANGHNIEYLILKRYLQFETNPLKRAYAWMESEKLRRWERHAFRRASLGVACSEYDRNVLLAADSSTPIVVVPNVIDTDYYTPLPGEGDPLTVMYQGGMDWFPNRDAVEYFVSSILPILRQRVPQVRFVVAGRNPSPDFLRRFQTDPGIEFTGTVDDMRPVIQRAQVCVVPLRIGSGTRLKILESAAMGKPVVSTRLGAEGLAFRDGDEIILKDDPSAFADAIADLLFHPQKRQSIATAARERVRQDYSFPALCSAVRGALDFVTRAAPILTA